MLNLNPPQPSDHTILSFQEMGGRPQMQYDFDPEAPEYQPEYYGNEGYDDHAQTADYVPEELAESSWNMEPDQEKTPEPESDGERTPKNPPLDPEGGSSRAKTVASGAAHLEQAVRDISLEDTSDRKDSISVNASVHEPNNAPCANVIDSKDDKSWSSQISLESIEWDAIFFSTLHLVCSPPIPHCPRVF